MNYEPPIQAIRDISEYLQQPIPDDNLDNGLEEHLRGLESTLYKLAEVKADWHKMLSEKKSQMLHPKDKDLTELDRTIMLNASVAVIQRDYDFLCRVEELADQRIDIIQMLLTL